MKLRLLLSLFLVFSPAVLHAQTDVLMVCDVLSKIDSYRDKIITVKGLVWGGFGHGYVLKDYEIKNECPQITKLGLHWPSRLSLLFLEQHSQLSDGPLTFIPDYEKIGAFIKEERNAYQDENMCYLATFMGELRSKEDVHIDEYADNLYAGNGYGQGGKYPALLVVKSLVNMQLVNNKNWEWKDKHENGEDFIRPGKERKRAFEETNNK